MSDERPITDGARWSALELQIDELVLHGFTPGEGQRIGAAVERELARLLAENGPPPELLRDSEIDSIDGGAFELRRGARAEEIGAQVALAIYRGLGR